MKNEATVESKSESTLDESKPDETPDQSNTEADQSNADEIKESNEESTSSMDPVEQIRKLLEQKLGLSVISETVDHGSRRVTLIFDLISKYFLIQITHRSLKPLTLKD